MTKTTGSFFLAAALLFSCSSNDQTTAESTSATAPDSMATAPAIREEAVILEAGTARLNSFVYSDSARTEKRPAVIVVPEWWGLNDYAKGRARQLAGLGYTALALDIYGGGQVAPDPGAAQALAMPFYSNPRLGADRIGAAIAYLGTRGEVDTARRGAMGYCFGGAMVLQAARLGLPLQGVVSFHGDFPEEGWPKTSTAQVLVCHGAADAFVPMAKYESFLKKLDSAGVRHSGKVYDSATHAFTNPAATETARRFNMPIRYNGAADTASWNDMKAFWRSVFGN
ncbi:MAG: dienelactone hydrolase family protein [Chitinophagaceae bacterium]|nr:MAG: dienelactone hydrolase family protein [Chitinophagaceae bacterium]